MSVHRNRPAFVTILALAVFLLGVINLIGAYAGIARWSVLSSLSLAFPLWGLILLNGMWGVIWLGLAWGLWRLQAWARLATMAAFPLSQFVALGVQAMFAQGDYEREHLPFVICARLIAAVLPVLILTGPRTRQAFERATQIHEDQGDKEPKQP